MHHVSERKQSSGFKQLAEETQIAFHRSERSDQNSPLFVARLISSNRLTKLTSFSAIEEAIILSIVVVYVILSLSLSLSLSLLAGFLVM